MPLIRCPHVHFEHRLLRAQNFQVREELKGIARWWSDAGAGVFALVGIGGAGKTALAERFLRMLPGVIAEVSDQPKDETLPVPDAVFVFSFYEASNPEAFFKALHRWCAREFTSDARIAPLLLEPTSTPSASQAREILQLAPPRTLLVLDGLERIQDDGLRGGTFGRIEDGGLRDLVLRIADGLLPNVGVLATSRFPLDDLRLDNSPLHHEVPVERIPERAAIQLLRDRGVLGTDERLRPIARLCGYHALTVDLAGGYIGYYGKGDPSTRLDLPSDKQLRAIVGAERDPKVRYILQQQARFARVASRYREALQRGDKTTLKILEQVCLFRIAVDVKTLIATINRLAYISSDREETLTSINRAVLLAQLRFLHEMRLVEQLPDGRFSSHPAIRDGFLSGLDPASIQRNHETVRSVLIASLGARPGGHYPDDPATLDRIEETIYHTLQAGKANEAWDLFQERLGGVANLGWRLAAYERSERICRAFTDGHDPRIAPLIAQLEPSSRAHFFHDWASFLQILGQLDEALVYHHSHNQLQSELRNRVAERISLCEIADVNLLKGRLAAASAYMNRAIQIHSNADVVGDYATRGYIAFLQGEVKRAYDEFEVAHGRATRRSREAPLHLTSRSGIRHALVLHRMGEHLQALRLAAYNREFSKKVYGPDEPTSPKCALLVADIFRALGELDKAEAAYRMAYDWAIRKDVRELLCWAGLVQAKILVARAHESREESHRCEALLADAYRVCSETIRTATYCGYGIYYIDLLLQRARVNLYRADTAAAHADIQRALFEGEHPIRESRLPEIFGATQPECGYIWGEAEGRYLLAGIHLLRAVRLGCSTSFDPATVSSLDAGIRELVGQALNEARRSAELHARLADPMGKTVESLVADIKRGKLVPSWLTELWGTRAAEFAFGVARQSASNGKTELPTDMDTPHEMKTTSPKLFISYTHDVAEWKERGADPNTQRKRVADLAEYFRQGGVDCVIDQHIDNPPRGWPRWMMDQISQADFVLVIATETYDRRFRGAELPEVGLGAQWEGQIITQEMYEAGARTNKFIPAVFDDSDIKYIPLPLRSMTRYNVAVPGQRDELYFRITGQPAYTPTPLGAIRRRPPRRE